MKGAPLIITVVAALAGLALPSPLAAQEESKETAVPDSAPSGATATPPAKTGKQALPPSKLPPDASAALIRASAAYEYGDMNQVVESARPVAEGLLPATSEEQIQAFRPMGAETAFTELLRKDPRARLDPTSTRPELVAFFESLRHQQIARQRSTRKMFWNFIPPVGQFQNDDNVRGWLILGVGVASFATLATSDLVLRKWKHWDYTFDPHHDTAVNLKTVNYISFGVLAATYIYGVFDGLIGYGKPIDEGKPAVSLFFLPGGGGLGFTF
jgi:hypothetical protein